MRLPFGIIVLTAWSVLGMATTGAQQRIEFPRQKFDRSRFQRPGQATVPATPAEPAEPEPAPAPEPAAAGASEFPFSEPPPATPPAAPPTPGAMDPAAAPQPLWEEVPPKWFDNAKDYEELLELQKKTGACLLLYFKRPSEPREKGLCSWFEKTTMPDIAWRKAMKYYLKLAITLPGNSAARDLAEKFRVGKTPTVLVVKPGGGLPMRVNVFEFAPNTRPQPIEVPLILESLKARSTAAYQTLF